MQSNVLAKSLTMLLTTLLIGALLGASITGVVTRHRLENVRALTDSQGFSIRAIELLDPISDEQRQTIEPLVVEAGGEIEAIVSRTRTEIYLVMEGMEQKLEPHLTEEQFKRLQDRRQTMRQRYQRQLETDD